MAIAIYALFDPRSPSEVRYIGQTSRKIQTRLRDHIAGAKAGKSQTHKTHWIMSLLADGVEPVARLVDLVADHEWQEMERFYIALHRRSGHPITNATEGGDGVANLSAESRAKISAALTGIKRTEDCKKKLSDAHKGRKLPDEQKAKIAAGLTGRACSDSTRKKIGGSNRGKKRSPEVVARARLWRALNPISDETRQKMRAAKIGRSPSSEAIEKMRATVAANRVEKLQRAGRIS